jgi:hypothetical protein
MKRSSLSHTRALPVLAAAVAATGLALAGCGASASGSGGGTAGSGGSASSTGSGSGSSASSGSNSTTTTSGSTASGSALFPMAVGNTWVYEQKLTEDHGTVTNRIASVTQAASGQRVVMKSRNDMAGLPHTTTSALFIVHPDGSISVPLTQFGSTGVTIKSGSAVWPSQAQLASGQPHTSTLVVTIAESGRTMRVKAHIVVRGAGTQTVTVPAGTYQATVINETMTEKIMGFQVTLDVRTWLASGVGPVKSEVLTKAGSLSNGITTEQVLKSFTKG